MESPPHISPLSEGGERKRENNTDPRPSRIGAQTVNRTGRSIRICFFLKIDLRKTVGRLPESFRHTTQNRFIPRFPFGKASRCQHIIAFIRNIIQANSIRELAPIRSQSRFHTFSQQNNTRTTAILSSYRPSDHQAKRERGGGGTIHTVISRK